MSRLPQFYFNEMEEGGEVALLRRGEHNHLKRVLRLKRGDAVLVSDGKGGLSHAVILDVGNDVTRVQIVSDVAWTPESPLEITLIQAIPKRRKMEWILQKATELGVCRVVPATSAYSIPRLSAIQWQRKKARWEQILREAAKQSYRARIPVLEDVMPLEKAMRQFKEAVSLFFTPEASLSLKACLDNFPGTNKMTLVIGPEGGFDVSESAFASDEGYQLCAMGPRIMRLETAVIKVLSVLQYVLGDV